MVLVLTSINFIRGTLFFFLLYFLSFFFFEHKNISNVKGVRTLSRLEAQCVMEDEMKIVEGARPIGSKKQ